MLDKETDVDIQHKDNKDNLKYQIPNLPLKEQVTLML